MARLDRLGNAKEIAQVGATIGREFSYDLLAAVADKTGVEIDAALGSPLHPMTSEQLNGKVRMLSSDILIGSLDDPDRPASELLQLVVGE